MQVRSLLATTAATAAVSLLPISAQAATMFGTNGIQFDQDTTIQFTFLSENQDYLSNLSIFAVGTEPNGTRSADKSSAVPLFYQNSADVQIGTNGGTYLPGTTPAISGNTATFTFLKGVEYTLGLKNFNGTSLALSPYVFSTSAYNRAAYLNASPANPQGTTNPPGGNQQAIFSGSIADLNAGKSVQISFEDGSIDGDYVRDAQGNILLDLYGNPVYSLTQFNDRDFNDFVISARVIPAPPLLLGLIALGTRVFFRQRRPAKA